MNDKNRVKVMDDCSECGETFETVIFQGKQIAFSCPPCREARARADEWQRQQAFELRVRAWREQWLTHVRAAPPRYRGFSWDDFAFDKGGDGNRKKVDAIREYAESFPVDRRPFGFPSLVLASATNGVGKTMLASMVLETIYKRFDAEALARETPPVQFWAVHDIKQRLNSAARYTAQETQEQVMRDFASMWLLIMDDVGKERMGGREAEEAYDTYFAVLNARYNANLPVLITTNLNVTPWQEDGPSLVDLMGRASVSRLFEMTEGKIYVIEGEDRR